MKNTMSAAKPAAKLPLESGDQFPEVVIEAERIYRDHKRLTLAISETEKTFEDASLKYQITLLGNVDLNSDQEIGKFAIVRNRIRVASERIPILQSELDALEKPFKSVSNKAASHMNYMCEEASRGHQEIAAQAIVSHFASLKDARSASSEAPAVTAWLNKRIPTNHQDPANMETVLARTREVIAELKMLREKLGGSIPSAAEMNKL
jgi:hypothetical protein